MKFHINDLGIHFFDRRSGNNVLVDELSFPEKLWSKAPKNVSIALTNKCDLSCPYCYAPKSSSTLNSDDILNWCKSLDQNGTLGIGFGGGEPFLYPDFHLLLEKIYNETNLAISITTHGHHLNEKLIDHLSKNINFLRISMDGLSETYESLRRKSFSGLIKKIKLIGERVKFGINYVVNSETINELEKAIELSEQLNCSEFLILPEVKTINRNGVSEVELEKIKEIIEISRTKMRLAISRDFSDTFGICDKIGGRNSYAHITADAVLKINSYDNCGVDILGNNVMTALDKLKNRSLS